MTPLEMVLSNCYVTKQSVKSPCACRKTIVAFVFAKNNMQKKEKTLKTDDTT